MSQHQVLLSFDIEEFDVPMEYGASIPFDEQVRISYHGTSVILDLLKGLDVKATFFSTVMFAEAAPALIKRIANEGHELGSHGWYHSSFENEHLAASKAELERLSGVSVTGFRMARMMPVDDREIKAAGYAYNSSLNPVFLPGRYNNFSEPRTVFMKDDVVQLPASATPALRLPLFWLSFHHLPTSIYKAMCVRTMRRDKYLNIYFHPWEFSDLSNPTLKLPTLITRNSNQKMVKRFGDLVKWMKAQGYTFHTLAEFSGNFRQKTGK